MGHQDAHGVAEVEPGVDVVRRERFRGNAPSTADGEGAGVAPGLEGGVQDGGAVGGADLEPPVGVQTSWKPPVWMRV